VTARRGAPAGAFDLDAARAARREAAGIGFKFKFGGKNYTCLPAKEWPITVMAYLSEGNMVSALEAILGEDQMEKFMAMKPTSGDVEDLMNAIGDDAGVDNSGN
jgi:hypothetical protein